MSSAAMSMETAPRRSRVIAGLLSLIAPGVGQLYAGRPRRGVALFAMLVAIQLMLLAVAVLLPASYAAIMSYAALVAIVCLGAFLFVLVDAVRLARRADGSQPVCRWSVCAAAVVAVWLVFIAVSTLSGLIKPHLPWRMFNLPSSSMQPTLRLGERLLGDMSYFKQHAPSRGDVIIYRLPKDPSTLYIKRVVALAGDQVVFRDGRAIVNGTAVAEPYADLGDPRAFYNNTAAFTVPADHVFVVGDNRANSTDSRVASQHGPVPRKNLVGRATQIFWSDEPDRAGLWVGTPNR